MCLRTQPAERQKMTQSVYVDTSVISYLTVRPSRDVRTAARQIETFEWWAGESSHFELFSSEITVTEAGAGNVEAASRPIEVLGEMTILDFDPDAEDLARVLLLEGAVPENAVDDARQIAIAAVNEIDYLLTWNFAHMANTITVPAIAVICERLGFSTPVITTPNQLKGGTDIGR